SGHATDWLILPRRRRTPGEGEPRCAGTETVCRFDGGPVLRAHANVHVPLAVHGQAVLCPVDAGLDLFDLAAALHARHRAHGGHGDYGIHGRTAHRLAAGIPDDDGQRVVAGVWWVWGVGHSDLEASDGPQGHLPGPFTSTP